MSFIYSLCYPDTREPFYIGKGDIPEQRRLDHIAAAMRGKHENFELELTIVRIISSGKQPELIVLEHVKNGEPFEAEKKWIKFALDCGWKLCNKAIANDIRERRAQSDRLRAVEFEERFGSNKET